MSRIAHFIFYGLGLLSFGICLLCIDIACDKKPFRIDATTGNPGQPTTHSFGGLVTTQYRRAGHAGYLFTEVNNGVFIPLALLAAIPPLLCAYPIFQTGRARYRASANQCPHCGYDLRATPNRCPECGRTPPDESPNVGP